MGSQSSQSGTPLRSFVRVSSEGSVQASLSCLSGFCGARDIGRQMLGAFDDNFMCGLHSHIFGVLPEYRNAGAGRMLKMAQREDALAGGIQARRSARMDADRQVGLIKPPQGSAGAGKD